MSAEKELKFDQIGYWSEIKHDILKEYASAYTKILTAEKQSFFKVVYIEGFAGAGIHHSKRNGSFGKGSPLVALYIEPKFKEYHFIELDEHKLDILRQAVESEPNVFFISRRLQ